MEVGKKYVMRGTVEVKEYYVGKKTVRELHLILPVSIEGTIGRVKIEEEVKEPVEAPTECKECGKICPRAGQKFCSPECAVKWHDRQEGAQFRYIRGKMVRVTVNSKGQQSIQCAHTGCKNKFVYDRKHHDRLMCEEHRRHRNQKGVNSKIRKTCQIEGCSETFMSYESSGTKNCYKHRHAHPSLRGKRGPRQVKKPAATQPIPKGTKLRQSDLAYLRVNHKPGIDTDVIRECNSNGLMLKKKALTIILKQPDPVRFTKALVKRIPRNVVVIDVVDVELCIHATADFVQTAPQTRTAAALDKALKEVKRDKPIAPPTPEVAPKSWWGKLFGTKGGET